MNTTARQHRRGPTAAAKTAAAALPTRASSSSPPLLLLFLLLLLLQPLLSPSSPGAAHAATILFVPLSSESHIAAFSALSAAAEQLGGHDVRMVVAKELEGAARASAEARHRALSSSSAALSASASSASASAHHRHRFVTYPLKAERFAADLAAMAESGFLRSMFFGYRVLAAMMEAVAGDEALLGEIKSIKPGEGGGESE